jgi:ribosome-binding ATPase YchF (GTP1/OBG family)
MRIGYDSSSMQDTYKLVKEGIYHLEGYGIEMLKEFKIDEIGLDILIKSTYKHLGLRTFFTTGEKETKA